MSLFVDASAMVAMMVKEADHIILERQFGLDDDRLCSALSLWETARALVKIRSISIVQAEADCETFVHTFDMRMVPIGAAEASMAIRAFDVYGRGKHPARLNMGDCFAYACARTNDARLLYKGDDFSQTDLA
ncbi:MAG: type II toxin-antitoxin system VapC family toxin [Sphingomonas taxi]